VQCVSITSPLIARQYSAKFVFMASMDPVRFHAGSLSAV